MAALYQLAVLGSPTDAQISEIEELVRYAVGMFNLRLGHEVGWEVRPEAFNPDQQRSSAAVFFGGENPPLANVAKLLERGIPLLPIASDVNRVNAEIPELLRPLNCLAYAANGPQRVATALLECAGLLPRQRRVFVSYRRGEAREAALQLFDALSARLFDVFLDTHGIPPAEDFQTMLWHRLCDSDVLVMLDTPGYFESRWTSAEFGRALAKGISVLRVGWPDATPSARTATASRAELLPEEVDPATGRLADGAVDRICLQLEEVRSQSHAVRSVNLVSNLRNAIQTIGGQIVGVGANKAVYVQLPDGRSVVVYPTVGVPTSTTLHDASTNSPDQSVAVVYDHVGLHPRWLTHLDWLGRHIHSARWVKASEAGWQFADWEA
ncbi:TPA: toll/interleukin-1 receptor domain-containing protein [Pseudomonas aeruginosa]|uniref:toll/interleukin-1 receptor domain-containing protein n=1 Tax=Pseudomonas aeruginosa TaxID=287 RepID=UPI0013EFE127|nr:toll/interleukin-1 receptor domain-containing protein [Pseudomonas aeruginosa]MCO3566907.1 toll/interleukin-1 receptor domain-containing protein [Pseudomonas aeruginosa]MCP9250924.1 toll/interleukin-1 receptor domain-containing protein [Pseudomonas aeruginosa]MDN3850399.1 toll/interleukin-1 receptor domain-containing protein [Pseudomonas aeruginosa]QII94061.1 toll/interleukin-1 receptor domain-containing protein [Pseudomonas aeruginosa]WCV63290.1 TIR domain-containing protein [Pseudomonas a